MKPIITTLEPGTNYVFHMIAVARAGFENAYSDAYADSVSPEDLLLLTKHRGALSWLDGSVGSLAPLFVFELACANPRTREELWEFFEVLQDGLRRGDVSAYFGRYRAGVADDPFVEQRDERYLLSLSELRHEIDDLAGVYLRSFEPFIEKVWPVERAKMSPVADELNAYFSTRDLIGKWEEVTGKTWRRPNYQIRLCAALQRGPQANSLAYDVNTFYYVQDMEWMKDFISHEVGTHILIDDNREVMRSDKYDQWLVYRGFENLARFFNFMVLGKERLYEMGPHYSVIEFERIYREVAAGEIGITPRELLVKGIEEFLRSGRRQTATR